MKILSMDKDVLIDADLVGEISISNYSTKSNRYGGKYDYKYGVIARYKNDYEHYKILVSDISCYQEVKLYMDEIISAIKKNDDEIFEIIPLNIYESIEHTRLPYTKNEIACSVYGFRYFESRFALDRIKELQEEYYKKSNEFINSYPERLEKYNKELMELRVEFEKILPYYDSMPEIKGNLKKKDCGTNPALMWLFKHGILGKIARNKETAWDWIKERFELNKPREYPSNYIWYLDRYNFSVEKLTSEVAKQEKLYDEFTSDEKEVASKLMKKYEYYLKEHNKIEILNDGSYSLTFELR